MRWITSFGVGLGLLCLGAPLEGGEATWPPAPHLTAVHVAADPILDGKGGDAAWAGAPWLAIEASLETVRVPVRLCACATDTHLYVQVVWADAHLDDHPRGTGAGSVSKSDRICVEFCGPLGSSGVPSPREPEKAAEFDADRSLLGKPQGGVAVWRDGFWTVELSRGRKGGPALAAETPRALDSLQVCLRDGSGPNRPTPWVSLTVGSPTHARDFEQDEPGQDASGMRAALAGSGKPPAWIVREHDGARCLVQECADETDARFPLALLDGVQARDMDLSVSFKALDGFKDRAAGLVWRVKDAGNHYILRANALEKNVVLYKMQDNLRVDLPPIGHEADYGVKVEFDPAAWHVLRVVALGERFQAYLDGRLLFEVVDKTFTEAGGVGLWTKSDSVTAFDDLLAVSLDAPPPLPASVPAPAR